ncbi:MAG: DNA polymerase I [Oscillospiraceae bacterium]|nr:DNA polymerase I [Oscillospiraceae bacterium]
MKLLAVDGNSILNRAYYGIKALATKDGTFTNGIYGFLTILLRMLQETQPDAVAIAFDTRAKTFRHEKYDGYKAQRKGMPDELAQQMPLLKELLGYLGYACVELEGFEADDLLGTFSKSCCQKGDDCVIATGDRDTLQLISGCVSVRLASTKGGKPQAELYDEKAIFEKYGVAPVQLIDVKALMGDASDNVPGVAGIGEKGALALIKEFGNLDKIYEDLDTLPVKDGVREKLRAGREMASLSRELVTINQDVPIDADIEHYRQKLTDNPKAYALMSRLEMFTLIDRLGVTAEAQPQSEPLQSSANPIEIVFNELPGELLGKGGTLDVLFLFQGNIPSAVCAITEEKLYLTDKNVAETAERILKATVKKRTNLIKNIYRFGLDKGFEPQNIVFDAEIAGYILNPTANDYKIARLAAEHGANPAIGLDNLLGAHSAFLEDCAVFTRLADILESKIEANGQGELFSGIELPLSQVLAGMEHAGFEIDTGGLKKYGENLEAEITRLQEEIYAHAGEVFNINSPKQLGVILFEKLGLPARTKTKTGYSTNAEVLEGLKNKHEIVMRVLQYRTVAKLKSTYVDGLLKTVGEDGRIHTSFQQTLTRTGRISSTEPNMQNIPVRTELGSELRRFFRAGSGCVLIDADYSQIELRVLAHIANDENMTGAFLSGEDIHTNTAAQVFDMPPLFVTPIMRSRAKAVNFGIVYGIGAYSLSQDIGVTVAEADKYIKSYLATYSGVRKFMEDVVSFGKENGYVKTLFERRRYLPELKSSVRQTREFGKRVAMNTPIQGTAADIIKIAMVRVFRRLKTEKLQSRLILQVHDELIVESPKGEADTVARLLKEEMEAAVSLTVPMEAEVGRGENWLEAK